MNTPSLNQNPPEKLFAEVSVRSKGGVSIFENKSLPTSENIDAFMSSKADIDDAESRLLALGFEVLARSEVGLSIAGPPALFEQVFHTKIYAEERLLHEGEDKSTPRTTTCYNADNNNGITGFINTANSELSDIIEGISLNEPMEYFANAFAPVKNYWHLNVPADVSLGMNADRAHRRMYTGKKVKVVMVDSGWYRHPFFTARGYRALPVALGPGTANPSRDENGHGTGESANIFSVAPDATLQMVKINFFSSVAAFNKAVSLNPDIITCSWGKSIRLRNQLSAPDIMLSAAIATAVRKGIIVVFSAGNGHYGFPGQHPDVISAGGSYMLPNGKFRASNYASGFISKIYKNRVVPDVCGLVGMSPGAQYIMLPVEPNDELDRRLSGGNHPTGDETSPRDGWAAFSGTSAAAPQIAGICALMKQANPKLTPKLARHILQRTARDVTSGMNAMRFRATAGRDKATGYGLADAYRAALLARWYFLRFRIVQPRPADISLNGTVPYLKMAKDDALVHVDHTNGDPVKHEYFSELETFEEIVYELDQSTN